MKELTKTEKIEQSIFKKYRKTIWTKFVLALKRYNLVEDGDKIAVCVSGGKDSMLLAKLMQMLQRFSETKFELEFICMDPGYNKNNRKQIEENSKLMNIPLTFFETNIFDAVFDIEKSPCYLCARMRRGHLYNKAKELGCNKIALAHHFNDVIETALMGMLYGAQLQTMPPKLRSKNFEGMQLIRPLYCVREDDILAWKRYNDLTFIQCACRFTEKANEIDSVAQTNSARAKTKQLIRELQKTIPEVDSHIFMSLHNVQIDTLLGVKHNGTYYDFDEIFQSCKQNFDEE